MRRSLALNLVVVAVLLLVWSGTGQAYKVDLDSNGRATTKVFKVSTWGNDEDEREEFGISRYDAMALVIRNSFAGATVVRDYRKVSKPNKVYVDGPGREDETTLSRKQMKIIASKRKPTVEDLCFDQKALLEDANVYEEEGVEVYTEASPLAPPMQAAPPVYAPPPVSYAPLPILLPSAYVLLASFPVERCVHFTQINNFHITRINQRFVLRDFDKHIKHRRGRHDYFSLFPNKSRYLGASKQPFYNRRSGHNSRYNGGYAYGSNSGQARGRTPYQNVQPNFHQQYRSRRLPNSGVGQQFYPQQRMQRPLGVQRAPGIYPGGRQFVPQQRAIRRNAPVNGQFQGRSGGFSPRGPGGF